MSTKAVQPDEKPLHRWEVAAFLEAAKGAVDAKKAGSKEDYSKARTEMQEIVDGAVA